MFSYVVLDHAGRRSPVNVVCVHSVIFERTSVMLDWVGSRASSRAKILRVYILKSLIAPNPK